MEWMCVCVGGMCEDVCSILCVDECGVCVHVCVKHTSYPTALLAIGWSKNEAHATFLSGDTVARTKYRWYRLVVEAYHDLEAVSGGRNGR